MKIKGRNLGIAIIYLVFFILFLFGDLGNFQTSYEIFNLFLSIILLLFFGWRFIKNMEEAFNQESGK